MNTFESQMLNCASFNKLIKEVEFCLTNYVLHISLLGFITQIFPEMLERLNDIKMKLGFIPLLGPKHQETKSYFS